MSIQDSDIEGMRAQISGTPNFSSIIQYIRLTQLKVHLEFLLDTTTFQILTIYVQGGYQAIVKDADADPKIVGAINYSPDNYPSAREALQALLDRTGSMVLNKLRKDEFKDVDPGSSLVKETNDFLNLISRQDHFSQVPSSGLSQGSAVVPTTGAFDAGSHTNLFGEYKASQGLAPGPGQALTTIPTEGHFGATSSGGVFGNASAGKFPSNITVTLNFNGFPASVNRDEPKEALSSNFALRPKNANNDGPDPAAVSVYQTGPQPRSIFADSSHETKNQADAATGSRVVAASALANATTTLPSDHHFPPSHLDPEQNAFVPGSHAFGGAFEGKFGSTSTPATGAFASTTDPSPFGESQVPHGSYRYNPTTGTLKASESGNTNKKTHFFATVEDETPNFPSSTIDVKEPAGSMFKESIPKEPETQLPPPRVSMFGDTPASTFIPGQEVFPSAPTDAEFVGPAFPPGSGFGSAAVSKFATGTVPAQTAEPVRKTVEVERPAQKVPFPAQKKTASKKEGLFDSMYAK
jgi:hypothetical protein